MESEIKEPKHICDISIQLTETEDGFTARAPDDFPDLVVHGESVNIVMQEIARLIVEKFNKAN